MGDRANILMKSNGSWDTGVYLYTHWDGTDLPATLQAALIRAEDRWMDDAYLARVIFCEMVRTDLLGTTGYGISAFVGDGRDRILRVNADDQTVTFEGKSWTFKEYIALNEERKFRSFALDTYYHRRGFMSSAKY